MRFFVKDMGIETGGIHIVTLCEKDAKSLDLHKGDRVKVVFNSKETVAVLDFADQRMVPQGKIGLFFEVLRKLKCGEGDTVEIFTEKKPESLKIIRKKLDGGVLTRSEIDEIINDIVDNKLTDIEITFFVSAGYVRGFNMNETIALTKSMIETGERLRLPYRKIVDFHCIGGVPGNRTTMIVVPILAAAGLIVPKTSSRAITSPAGTADTMEVLCKVSLSEEEIKKVIDEAGGCIAWGGAMNLAPADERIITIEHPLSVDAEGQMLASIMAKKGSVSATHLLIDIPIGKGAKIPSRKEALRLGKKFRDVGKSLGIKTEILITDGTEPVGNGIGPLLEARDVLWLFERDPARPMDLEERSLVMAGEILELAGVARKGEGYRKAKHILESGEALRKMQQMIYAQGGVRVRGDQLVPAQHSFDYVAKKAGKISFDNVKIARIARMAGAPLDIDAGIYLYRHKGDRVKKWDKIFTVFSSSKEKLNHVREHLVKFDGVIIE